MKGRIVKNGKGFSVEASICGCWVKKAGIGGVFIWDTKEKAEWYAARNGIELTDSKR